MKMAKLQQILKKIRPVLWVIGGIAVIIAIWFAIQTNWSMATNFALVAGAVVGIPELLSENVKPSDEPLPSAEEVGKHQRDHKTATLAESVNDIRAENATQKQAQQTPQKSAEN